MIKKSTKIFIILLLATIVVGFVYYREMSKRYGPNSECDLMFRPSTHYFLGHIGGVSQSLIGKSFMDESRVDWCRETPTWAYFWQDVFCWLLLITSSIIYWFYIGRWYWRKIKNKLVWRIFFIVLAIILYIAVLWMIFTLAALILSKLDLLINRILSI